MAKKKLSKTQKDKKKYTTIEKVTRGLEYVAMALPFIIMCAINYDAYFVYQDGVKMSIAVILAIGVLALTIFGIVKERTKRTLWPLIAKMVALGIICILIGTVINDLGTIILIGVTGLIGAQILDYISLDYKKKKEKIIKAEERASEEELVEQIKEEHNGR